MTESDPASPDSHLGYSRVDAQPDLATVLAGMDATAAWPAVRQLRAWTEERLAVGPGDRLLDVGCGLGDAAIALARQVAPNGQVVGVDVSEAMLDVAKRRAGDAKVEVDFHTANAMALAEPDESFDGCRSERVLQWLPDPSRAIAEMVRVLRPGGRLALIDSDWRTLTVDLPDDEAASAVRDAVWQLRGPPASVGSHLLNLCRDLGLTDLEVTAATHIWASWDPDRDEAPPGLFPMGPVVEQMVAAELLDPALGRRFLDGLVTAGRTGRFFMSVGMFAVFGRRRRP